MGSSLHAAHDRPRRGADSIRSARELVTGHRNTAVAVAQSGASVIIDDLKFDEAAAAARALVADRLRGASRTAFTNYKRYIKTHPARSGIFAPLPVTDAKLAAFLLHRSVTPARRGVAGVPLQSSGLAATARALKRYVMATEPAAWRVTDQGEAAKTTLIDVLGKAMPSRAKLAAHLSMADLQRLHQLCVSDPSPRARQTWALTASAVGLQMRGSEWGGKQSPLRLRDVSFSRVGMSASIVFSKTSKRTVSGQQRFAPHLPKAMGWLCASKAVQSYFDAVSDWEPTWGTDAARGNFPLFCVLRRGRATAEPMTVRAGMAQINGALHRIGIAPVGAHFGRHSGANLYLAELGWDRSLNGVDADQLRHQIGGWRGPGVMHRHYQRLGAAYLSTQVKRAMAGTNVCCRGR